MITCNENLKLLTAQVIIWKTCSTETSQKGRSVGGVTIRPCSFLTGAIGGMKYDILYWFGIIFVVYGSKTFLLSKRA